jgi:hypothetical protein
MRVFKVVFMPPSCPRLDQFPAGGRTSRDQRLMITILSTNSSYSLFHREKKSSLYDMSATISLLHQSRGLKHHDARQCDPPPTYTQQPRGGSLASLINLAIPLFRSTTIAATNMSYSPFARTLLLKKTSVHYPAPWWVYETSSRYQHLQQYDFCSSRSLFTKSEPQSQFYYDAVRSPNWIESPDGEYGSRERSGRRPFTTGKRWWKGVSSLLSSLTCGFNHGKDVAVNF